MNYQYVKTSNHHSFMNDLKGLDKSSKEARILLVWGEPGTGKTRVTDHYGAESNAIYIAGMPGMSLTYIKEGYQLKTGQKAGLVTLYLYH